ncbi:TlyA family RNA methyltransferase [Haloactinomyces albus]|uniref:23S rRNA (Cytidine1920-2'-O)/16S rRNA (Cytidine1409-2'-O)-methyltransferase n=1 Tax=Haloactinomyces albus TaxID=1352928 RepID=A0AAE4CJQ3_9ACTN|nr:TlyA family RNA methyltransferase [Haloactinomyces albus]MDR7300310.1 23S rRNA (cytidine1920-2'-O)/16S rRNA (cytidine1409-2'-O)-methyltransferase [Haloactinomyces albus]
MPRRVRLDAELVRRGLARSREQASELIAAGRVSVRGMIAAKPATAVETDVAVVVSEDAEGPGWVSRGAYKLLGAFDVFEPDGLTVAGRRCLDAGASTGGFTDVLLQRGAREVVAVDVGYGQLDWKLQTDDRVRIQDRTNVRSLSVEEIGGPVDLVVADLSFISLRLVLPALQACMNGNADLVVMVKPQFEVGKQRLGSGGVVRDPQLRAEAVLDVVNSAAGSGLGVHGVVASPLPGPSGNVEYFVWLHGDERGDLRDSEAMVTEAVRTGPQSPAGRDAEHGAGRQQRQGGAR